MKLLKFAILCQFFLLTCCGQNKELFVKDTYKKDGFYLPYRFHIPEKTDTVLPLVLYFHGAGERGTDNEITLKNGIINFVSSENLLNHPCYILVPQCPKNMKWVNTDWSLPEHTRPEEMSVPMTATIELLKSLLSAYQIDTNRIYVTGLSMGGFATWDAVSRFPQLFAAALPICGGGDVNTAQEFRQVPVWAFHGDVDDVVLPIRSVNMVEAINKCGGHAKLTMYEDMGHNVWNKTYANQEVIDWVFLQKKSKKVINSTKTE